MFTEVIFDLETKKLFSEIDTNDPANLGVSIVSLYERVLDENFNETEGQMHSFWERDFDRMWPIFQNAKRIIAFNSLHFDIPALTPYANFPFGKLPHFDIMAHIKEAYGKRVPLDAVATETLDRQKTDHGLNAVLYWKNGDKQSLAKLKKYCEEDVIITRDVYDFVLGQGHVLFKDKWNTLRKVELDFSYPKEKAEEKQIGLF